MHRKQTNNDSEIKRISRHWSRMKLWMIHPCCIFECFTMLGFLSLERESRGDVLLMYAVKFKLFSVKYTFKCVMSSVLILFIFVLPSGSNYYVRILSTIDRELLKPNASVALHKHSNALVDVLPPEADSSIMMLTSGETLTTTLSKMSSFLLLSRFIIIFSEARIQGLDWLIGYFVWSWLFE